MKHILILTILLAFGASAKCQYSKNITIQNMLKTDTTVLGKPIQYPCSGNTETIINRIVIPPGANTGWHKHTIPVFAIVMQGTLTVEMEDKSTKSYPTGSSFAEMQNVYHNGKNQGSEDVILIAIYIGKKGELLSIKK